MHIKGLVVRKWFPRARTFSRIGCYGNPCDIRVRNRFRSFSPRCFPVECGDTRNGRSPSRDGPLDHAQIRSDLVALPDSHHVRLFDAFTAP